MPFDPFGKLPYSDIDIGDGIPYSDLKDTPEIPEIPEIPDFGDLAGKTIRLPSLIETKTITGVNETVFSNLNGDIDEIYFLTFNLSYTLGAGGVGICFLPNNLNTNLRSSAMRNFITSHDTVSQTSGLMLVNQGGNGDTVVCRGNFTIYAKTGVVRLYNGQSVSDKSTETINQTIAGRWNETSTNITSLVITPLAGTISGVVKLYKMVDIEF